MTRGLFGAAAMVFIISCGDRPAEAPSVPSTALDHILIGAPDLDTAVADIERRTGARAQPGGSHPGAGTRNALLSLGDGAYLEIIAPDPAQKPGEFGTYVASLRTMTPIGWAYHTDDLDGLRAALAQGGVQAQPVVPGSRRRPDGKMLRWRTFEIGPEEDVSPFFIQWDTHPSMDAVGGCEVGRITAAGLKPNVVRALGLTGKDSVIDGDAAPGLHFVLRCRAGSIEF